MAETKTHLQHVLSKVPRSMNQNAKFLLWAWEVHINGQICINIDMHSMLPAQLRQGLCHLCSMHM